jgi:RNA-directed DNA polymerase
MGRKRQQNHNQLVLAFMSEHRGEAPGAPRQGSKLPVADNGSESPACVPDLMGEICEPNNLKEALKRVVANKGSPGVDGMRVDQLPGYLRKHWPTHRAQLLAGTYCPRPVKRVEIPKPGGGKRLLGIPRALDRFIQQAILQVLQRAWDPTFSEHSYGFRPGRSAHQAVARAQGYIAAGNGYVVDLDLEKFFDRVNHDILMSRIAKRVADKRLLKLLRAFLNAGVMENGLVSPTTEGTPQGGPLSPLLSNLLLDEFDRELERRGHRFVRYADDCNVYVRSERAGQRVMASLTRWLTETLKLRVNTSKSAVDQPHRRKFLGFSFAEGDTPKRRLAPQSIQRFKQRVRELTRPGIGVTQTMARLKSYLQGWLSYYGFCETPSVLQSLERWVRRRLRLLHWQYWQTTQNRRHELRRRGVNEQKARQLAGSSKGPWRISSSPTLHAALPNAYFSQLGLPPLVVGTYA